MTATLGDLLTPSTATDEEQRLLSVLLSAGFPVGDWIGNNAGLLLSRAFATSHADYTAERPAITASGFVTLAAQLDDRRWLDLAAQAYLLERGPATTTVIRCALGCTRGLGPLVVNQGFAARAASGRRYTYRGSEPVQVPDGATSVPIDLEAEVAGAAYVEPPSTITEIVTPLPGLTIGNPPLPLDYAPARRVGPASPGIVIPSVTPPGYVPVASRTFLIEVLEAGDPGVSGSVTIFEGGSFDAEPTLVRTHAPIPAVLDLGDGVSIAFTGSGFVAGSAYVFGVRVAPIIRQGVDAESNESLARRCRGRWPDLGTNWTAAKFELHIAQISVDAGLGVSRVTVRPSGTVPGQTEIHVAAAGGDPGPATIQILQERLTARLPETEGALVSPARNFEVAAVGTVFVPAATLADAKVAAELAWTRYLAELPIGGDPSTGLPGVVRMSAFKKALLDAGAIDLGDDVSLNGMFANLPIARDQVAVAAGALADTLTWSPV